MCLALGNTIAWTLLSRHQRGRRLTLAWQPRRDSEAGKPYAVVVVDEHIFRFDVLMCESMSMDLAKCCRQANSNTQDAGHIERVARGLVQESDPEAHRLGLCHLD